MTRKQLLAVDGDNLLHRSFHALGKIDQEDNPNFGHSVMPVVTFMRALNKALRNEYYTHVAVAWDIRHTWLKRFDILQEHGIHYKDRENGMTDEGKEKRNLIRKQKIITHSLLTALSIPSFISPRDIGVESDDILGCIAKHAKVDLVDILTSDKDMAQIINDKTRIINPYHGVIDEFKCSEIFHVDPEQIVEFMCLIGDDSDNVPGIYGCGAVTAKKLLAQYGSIKGILKNKKHIKGKVGKALNSGEYIPLDVIRSVIELDVDAFGSKHEIFKLKPMNMNRIREHISDPANMDKISSILDQLKVKGSLIKELGI